METYIHTSSDAAIKFYKAFQGKGPVVMLNLLKFKEVADYSDFPEIKPAVEVSGEKAYRIYMKEASPLIEKAGSKVLFYGKCQDYLIGPTDEKWDKVLLVHHESVDSFVKFAKDEEYVEILGHRTAGLMDCRLLPITEFKGK